MKPGDAVKACGDFGVKRMCLSISLLGSVFRLHVFVFVTSGLSVSRLHRSKAVSLWAPSRHSDNVFIGLEQSQLLHRTDSQLHFDEGYGAGLEVAA